jgi:Nuclease-related domain
MAKIYPEEVSNLVRKDPKLSAEIKVYDALRQQCRSNWLIFYHVAWLGRVSTEGVPRDGETDFIIAHPDYGILLIEVKGGGIRYEGVRRQWISTDRERIDHDIDPFTQVVQCKYALINKLKSLPLWSQRWIEVGHAVAFPDSYLSHTVLPPEAPAEIIIDARDLSHLPERIIQIFQYWHGQQSSLEKPDPALLRDLERIIAPTIRLRNPLSIQVNDDEREIIRLTEEQYRLLTMLSKTRRAAISGCAGSGKTMMAIEKAKRLANEGFRTLLTCYNRPLSEYLQDIAGKRENLFVCTFHQLCSRMAREADIDSVGE